MRRSGARGFPLTPALLTAAQRRASMKGMGRRTRTLAAVLAGLALVAALPAPCGCAPERSASKHADEHACCAPPTGVRAVDHGCCDETPAAAPAVPSPVGTATVPVMVAAHPVGAPSALLMLARPPVTPAFSLPPTVLRI
jgi:hypothetical protein